MKDFTSEQQRGVRHIASILLEIAKQIQTGRMTADDITTFARVGDLVLQNPGAAKAIVDAIDEYRKTDESQRSPKG